MKKLLINIFYIFFPLLIGISVSLITSGSFNLQELKQPPLSPPSILFPIVWTILYLLIGISYYLYKKGYPVLDDRITLFSRKRLLVRFSGRF